MDGELLPEEMVEWEIKWRFCREDERGVVLQEGGMGVWRKGEGDN